MPATKMQVECYGGPYDGYRMKIYGRSSIYRFPSARGTWHMYRLDKIRGGLFYIGVEEFDGHHESP